MTNMKYASDRIHPSDKKRPAGTRPEQIPKIRFWGTRYLTFSWQPVFFRVVNLQVYYPPTLNPHRLDKVYTIVILK